MVDLNPIYGPIDDAIDFILNQTDINISDEYGNTLVHKSCWRKDGLPLVELLLYLGIDKDRKGYRNMTALEFV
jgi:hypothetical protein